MTAAAYLDPDDGPLDLDEAPGALGPYGDWTEAYRNRQWPTFPVPYGQKAPPPKGVIGKARRDPTVAQMDAWTARKPWANIAGATPRQILIDGRAFDVVFVDVDDYRKGGKIKTGGATVREIEAVTGCRFPPTIKATSRGPGISGKYAYLVETGEHLTDALPDVEILQWWVRYVVLPPSVNNDSGGTVTVWRQGCAPTGDPDGRPLACVPRIRDVTRLPLPLVEHLRGPGPRAGEPVDTAEFRHWLANLDDTAACTHVRDKVTDAVRRLHADRGGQNGRHPVARNASLALLRAEHNGHHGIAHGLRLLRKHYIAACHPDRDQRTASADFDRMVRPEALGLILATPTPAEQRFCVCPEGLAAAHQALIDAGDLDEAAEFAREFRLEMTR